MGGRQPTERVELKCEHLLSGGRRLPQPAGGNLDVLILDCVDDVARRDFEVGELFWFQPDPHGVVAAAENLDLTDARDAIERIDDVNARVVGEEGLVERLVWRNEIDGEQERRRLLADDNAGALGDVRQLR